MVRFISIREPKFWSDFQVIEILLVSNFLVDVFAILIKFLTILSHLLAIKLKNSSHEIITQHIFDCIQNIVTMCIFYDWFVGKDKKIKERIRLLYEFANYIRDPYLFYFFLFLHVWDLPLKLFHWGFIKSFKPIVLRIYIKYMMNFSTNISYLTCMRLSTKKGEILGWSKLFNPPFSDFYKIPIVS